MADGSINQSAMVLSIPQSKNPFQNIQDKLKEVEIGFKVWLSKQSLVVEAAVVTATGAVQGAALGGVMGTLNSATPVPSPPPGGDGGLLNPQALASLQQAQALAGGPLVQARNFAVMTGVNAGLASVMKRIRGKVDVESSMVAAFGSGAAYSLVSGMGGPNLAGNAVSYGLFFALIQGALFKVGERFSNKAVETIDPYYAKTGSMLSSLGLQRYEKIFKKGLLTDSTLPLLTDSALKDVNIPPGPRLIILDHVHRDPELKDRRV